MWHVLEHVACELLAPELWQALSSSPLLPIPSTLTLIINAQLTWVTAGNGDIVALGAQGLCCLKADACRRRGGVMVALVRSHPSHALSSVPPTPVAVDQIAPNLLLDTCLCCLL